MSVLSNMSPLKESSVQDASNTATPAKEAKIDATRFKTKLCRHYMESGVCPFQSRCVFSHGQVELRTSDENRTSGIVSEQSLRDHQIRTAPALFTTPPRSPTESISPLPASPASYCMCAQCRPVSRPPPMADYDSYRYNPYSFHPYTYLRSNSRAQSPTQTSVLA